MSLYLLNVGASLDHLLPCPIAVDLRSVSPQYILNNSIFSWEIVVLEGEALSPKGLESALNPMLYPYIGCFLWLVLVSLTRSLGEEESERWKEGRYSFSHLFQNLVDDLLHQPTRYIVFLDVFPVTNLLILYLLFVTCHTLNGAQHVSSTAYGRSVPRVLQYLFRLWPDVLIEHLYYAFLDCTDLNRSR